MQSLFYLTFQRSAAENHKAEEGQDAQNQADDPRDAVGVQLAGIIDAEEQKDVRQQPDANVHQKVDQRIRRETAAPERKDKVADQRHAAQDRHDEIKAEARVAVEPVGEDQQRRDEQQQAENLPRAVVAAAHDVAQHQQDRRRPDGHQQAEMTVGRLVQKQKVERAAHNDERRQHKRDDFIQQGRAVDARCGRGEIRLPYCAGQSVLAQRAERRVPADLDMTMRAGVHFSTSVAYSATSTPSFASSR